ncbi:purine nucleoside phosphorylase [Mycoplasma haemocanis str. Illinois]|uniref:Uridine phosphorylase n=1 Tax=Mycoplasma haemocanis (strain Illinois) TaxID=1111676 RepID=H6N5U6_MYCHN|nr:purine-nucleoside phosphorylase [Mycoplasma haemocanis]AEW45056.1 purine nucleoside phosphorylase [Mycoplasma haemocanis str. Illinois]
MPAPTPHISAKLGEIAKTVLMPGDPLRAKWIAENYLTDVKLVSSVRNIFFYTGKYKGKEVTVGASGMGIPSMGIYSYELFAFYGVENIIRVGSSGSYKPEIKVGDVVLVTESIADSGAFSKIVLGEDNNKAFPDSSLNERLKGSAKALNHKLLESKMHSSEVFYWDTPIEEVVANTGADCVEMESYALFVNAKKLGKKAACIVTISDNIATKEFMSSKEREVGLRNMIEIALGIL